MAALPAFLPLCQKPVLLGKVRGGVSADNGGKLQAGQGGDTEMNSMRRREIVVDLNGTLVNQAFLAPNWLARLMIAAKEYPQFTCFASRLVQAELFLAFINTPGLRMQYAERPPNASHGRIN